MRAANQPAGGRSAGVRGGLLDREVDGSRAGRHSPSVRTGDGAGDLHVMNVRYIVDDVDAAVTFYTTHLGFTLLSSAAPAFADVKRGELRLLLSDPRAPAAGTASTSGRRRGG